MKILLKSFIVKWNSDKAKRRSDWKSIIPFCHCRRLIELRKDEEYEETETEAILQTAKEEEDIWEAYAAEFTPAPRITGMYVT